VLEADYPTLLTNLLRYPAPSEIYPFDPHLIVSQAIFLRSNITPAAGVEVVIQNQDILGVRAQPPERPPEESRDRGGRGRETVRGGGMNGSVRGRGGVRGGYGGLAAGLFERAQAAGAILSLLADQF
jgi:TBC1 domain family protein 5